MTTHTVIESLAAYAAIRSQDPAGERVWWTTSPYLLVNLPLRGETVRSPEAGLPQEQFDGLARAARDLGDGFCAWLQEECGWADYARFRFILAGQLTRCFFTAAYKALLLSRVRDAAGAEPAACAGNPAEPGLSGLSLAFGRVDTLYAVLAAAWPGSGISVVPHELPAEAAQAIDRQVRFRRMGRVEKALSLLNNTPGSFLFKAWRTLRRRRLLPLRRLALWPLGRRTFWVHKECELLEEAALGILGRGGRLAQLPALPAPDLSLADPAGLPRAGDLSRRLEATVREAAAARGVQWIPAFDAALGLVARRTLGFLDALRRNLAGLTTGFESVVRGMRPGDEILTSALTGPVGGLFYSFCRSRGIRVNAFDHGVTLGLSEWSLSAAQQAGMLAADRGFYHCPRAVAAVRSHAPWQEAHAVGLPRAMARPTLRPVQRRLGRRLLGIGPDEHVVMYASDLERNNFVYGPHQDNDLQFLDKTRAVTAALCRAYPRSRVVLKLYPTQRYADAYDFSDLAGEFPNLRIVGGVDFRFLRAAADLVFASSTQSTLGWVSGSGAPFAYLDFVWSPGRVDGLRLQMPGIPGLAAAVLPDAGGVCAAGPASVGAVLFRGKQ